MNFYASVAKCLPKKFILTHVLMFISMNALILSFFIDDILGRHFGIKKTFLWKV
jgi:hypothetical protein